MRAIRKLLGLACVVACLTGCSQPSNSNGSVEELFTPVETQGNFSSLAQGIFPTDHFETSSDAEEESYRGYFACTEGGDMTVIINEGTAELTVSCDGKVHEIENVPHSSSSNGTKMEVRSDKETGSFQLQLVGAKS